MIPRIIPTEDGGAARIKIGVELIARIVPVVNTYGEWQEVRLLIETTVPASDHNILIDRRKLVNLS